MNLTTGVPRITPSIANFKEWLVKNEGEAALYFLEPEWKSIWIGAKGEADFEVGINGGA